MMKNRTRNEIITAILGIKIEVSSDWLYKEINNTAVTFVTEKTLPSAHKSVVVVSVKNVPKDMSLDVFTQGNMKAMDKILHLFISLHQIRLSYQISLLIIHQR